MRNFEVVVAVAVAAAPEENSCECEVGAAVHSSPLTKHQQDSIDDVVVGGVAVAEFQNYSHFH